VIPAAAAATPTPAFFRKSRRFMNNLLFRYRWFCTGATFAVASRRSRVLPLLPGGQNALIFKFAINDDYQFNFF
jgi:hypothetical protein